MIIEIFALASLVLAGLWVACAELRSRQMQNGRDAWRMRYAKLKKAAAEERRSSNEAIEKNEKTIRELRERLLAAGEKEASLEDGISRLEKELECARNRNSTLKARNVRLRTELADVRAAMDAVCRMQKEDAV